MDDLCILTEFQVTGKSSDDSSALAQHRACVYQAAYLEILRSAIGAAGCGQGFVFDDGSLSLCIGVFNILIVILDYEEVYITNCVINHLILVEPSYYLSTRATTTLGAQSKFPCPICLVPRDLLWDLTEVLYPRRTRGGARWLIIEANSTLSAKAAKKILDRQSIRSMPVSSVRLLLTII